MAVRGKQGECHETKVTEVSASRAWEWLTALNATAKKASKMKTEKYPLDLEVTGYLKKAVSRYERGKKPS